MLLHLLPPTRPMDDVPLAPHLPQEEEIAMATMGSLSLFNCFYFPKRLSEVFAREVLFEGVDGKALRSWVECLRDFLAKLGALFPGRRLILKNPAHSARISYLRKIFPRAKFIHIHRHPFDVFRSTQKLYRSLLPLLALQPYDDVAIDEHILWSYVEVMNRLLDSLEELPAHHLSTVTYEELVTAPVATLVRIYRELDLGDFSHVAPVIQPIPAKTSRTAMDESTSSA
jgi:hypothetical protein